jgi:predicted glycosyltransferase
MKIWIDIGHVAQLNFYLQSIKRLSNNNQVYLSIINRGALPSIAKYEIGKLNNVKTKIVGKHRGNIISIIFEGNLLRLLKLFVFAIKYKPNLHFSNGFIGSIICKFLRIPAYTFGDDPDKLDFRLKSIFSEKTFYCLDKKVFRNMNILNTPKEWAYLSPKFFKPNKNVLKSLDLEPYSYVFAREVITTTTNYNEQVPDLILSIADDLPASIPVVLSLENKSKRLSYPKHWKLLAEPVNDMHSIIYHSKVLISSGDSMAREGAILGVPSLYIGMREMQANNQLTKFGKLIKLDSSNAVSLLKQLYIKDINLKERAEYRNSLQKNFIDLTDFICNLSKKRKY